MNNDDLSVDSIAWKKIVLIAGAVVIGFVFVAVIIRLVKDDTASSRQTLKDQAMQAIQVCALSENEQTCKEETITKSAASASDVSICDLHENDAQRDNCYWKVAKTVQDPKICIHISDTNKNQRCADGIYARLAADKQDATICASIIDTGRSSECYNAFKEILTAKTCTDDSTVCQDLRLVKTAEDEGDISYCLQVQDSDLKTDCVIALEELEEVQELYDSDEDGLTNGQEKIYGTDPSNPDTDNDTYLDGDEVAAGYDPNGPGLLQ